MPAKIFACILQQRYIYTFGVYIKEMEAKLFAFLNSERVSSMEILEKTTAINHSQ